MKSRVRSAVVAVAIVLIVASSGCIGAFGPDDTSGTAAPDDGDPTTVDSNRLVIEDNATRTRPSRSDRDAEGEYITLRYQDFGEAGPQPLDVSGYTVTYGGGPTYTIPDNVSLGRTPGGSIYLWTGDGEDRAFGAREGLNSVKPEYVLHAGLDGPLVAQDGTTITVRNRSGGIVARDTVTPTAGTVPFVPTRSVSTLAVLNGSIDTIEESKEATPFALRAPTYVPEGYQLDRLSMTQPGYRYSLFYSKEPNADIDYFFVSVAAPRSVNESDRPGGSHRVTVGDQTGYYATQGTGDGARGHLQCIGPDGWGYFLNGPPDEERLVRIGESMAVVEGNATERVKR